MKAYFGIIAALYTVLLCMLAWIMCMEYSDIGGWLPLLAFTAGPAFGWLLCHLQQEFSAPAPFWREDMASLRSQRKFK
jgi:Na+-transporting NADH:ubiquinone oxidoreductase subunit NqrE